MGAGMGIPLWQWAPGEQMLEIQVDVFSDAHCEIGNSLDLFSGPGGKYLELGVPLYRAALEGDWKTAMEILKTRRNLANARIGKTKDTALHIAAAAGHTEFVKELVKLMSKEDLKRRNANKNTALCFAAASGHKEIARVMVEKNNELPLIRGSDGMTPLLMATLLGHRKMVHYLKSVTDIEQFTQAERFELLITAMNSDLYGLALEILNKYPALAEYQDPHLKSALLFLAQQRLKPSSIQGGRWTKWITKCYRYSVGNHDKKTRDQALELVKKIWGGMIKKNYKEISHCLESPSRFLFAAAEVGNTEFIAILVGSYPDLIWEVNDDGISIFHIAVSKRQVEVFNLIYEIGAIKDLIATYTDNNRNNMLHLAAMSPPPGSHDTVSGAALQMQRELLWYKAVEDVVPRQFRTERNRDNKTPESLFTETHEKLRKDGEDWMKTTANSCSLVAALIATVVFTAAFTVPGGNDQNIGIPIFQHNPIFVLFAISDALSFITSTVAILMFLGMLTSRYSEDDFLKSLPQKLIIGLTMLSVSMACMMVAFASTFFIIFQTVTAAWMSIPIIVACLVAIPVVLFACQQFPLLLEIYRSTYQARYIFRPRKHKIFYQRKPAPFFKGLTSHCLGKHD